MKTLAVFIILPALLRAQSGDVKCHSDFSEDGIAINKQCQVSFKLSSDNGCPVVTSDTPRFSSVGMKFYSKINTKVEKILKEIKKASPLYSENCRFDGDLLICNCGSDLCNKDRGVIWNIFLKTNFELSNQCRRVFIETAWAKVSEWSTTTVSVRKQNHLNCIDSNSNTPVLGDHCVATFPVMPGTCYITGYPVLSAYNSTEEECISKNTVRITCDTDNCNGDMEILKNQITNGMSVFGGGHIIECKKQLKQSLVTTMTTTVKPTTTQTTNTASIFPITTNVEPPTKQTTTTSKPSIPTCEAKRYYCANGWAFSNRPNTVPACFKSFDLSKETYVDRSDYPLKPLYNFSVVDSNYMSSKQFCVEYHNAILPTIEYETDMMALGGGNSELTYLGARSYCNSNASCRQKIMIGKH